MGYFSIYFCLQLLSPMSYSFRCINLSLTWLTLLLFYYFWCYCKWDCFISLSYSPLLVYRNVTHVPWNVTKFIYSLFSEILLKCYIWLSLICMLTCEKMTNLQMLRYSSMNILVSQLFQSSWCPLSSWNIGFKKCHLSHSKFFYLEYILLKCFLYAW